MSKYDLFVDYEYEKMISADRELHVSGAYTPVKGIYSLGWQGWRDEPAASFVEELLEWHNGFARDHAGQPFSPSFAPLIAKGELTLSELKNFFISQMAITSQFARFEGEAEAKAHVMGAREARDMIARHLFEESGHNEMLADFMVGAFGMDRIAEVYPLTNPRNWPRVLSPLTGRPQQRYYRLIRRLNSKGHFVEVAAAEMLIERFIPKANHAIAVGLREHYSLPNRYLMFFDVHSYIDVYHERFGQYLLAKYATTREMRRRAREAFQNTIITIYDSWRDAYESLPIHRR